MNRKTTSLWWKWQKDCVSLVKMVERLRVFGENGRKIASLWCVLIAERCVAPLWSTLAEGLRITFCTCAERLRLSDEREQNGGFSQLNISKENISRGLIARRWTHINTKRNREMTYVRWKWPMSDEHDQKEIACQMSVTRDDVCQMNMTREMMYVR